METRQPDQMSVVINWSRRCFRSCHSKQKNKKKRGGGVKSSFAKSASCYIAQRRTSAMSEHCCSPLLQLSTVWVSPHVPHVVDMKSASPTIKQFFIFIFLCLKLLKQGAITDTGMFQVYDAFREINIYIFQFLSKCRIS